jgi:hypothetical protein
MIKLTDCKQFLKKRSKIDRKATYFMERYDYFICLCPELLELRGSKITKIHQQRIKFRRLGDTDWHVLEDIKDLL